MMSKKRISAMKQWLEAHNITYRAVGDKLGVTVGGAYALLTRDTIPTDRYAQLVDLGFPKDILPEPMDLSPGPKPKVPHFPGMAQV